MKLHYLQHASFEDLGWIGTWASSHEKELTGTRLFLGEQLPALDSFDGLIVLGGPMNVSQEAEYPWLGPEKQLIKSAIEAKKKVLGICLGAQLIADVLGARVYPNEHKEIGWFPIELTEKARKKHFQGYNPQALCFHWHSETFELPEDAKPIASSIACQNQGFIYEEHVLAIQFHMELRANDLKDMIEHCGNDIVPGEFVQSAEEMLAVSSDTFFSMNRQFEVVLNQLFS